MIGWETFVFIKMEGNYSLPVYAFLFGKVIQEADHGVTRGKDYLYLSFGVFLKTFDFRGYFMRSRIGEVFCFNDYSLMLL